MVFYMRYGILLHDIWSVLYMIAGKTKSISEYLLEILQPQSGTLQAPAKRLLINKLPLYGTDDDKLKWIPYTCTDWDSIVDLSSLFGQNTVHDCRYCTKAAIFHVHGDEAAAQMTAGHYVMIIKQGNVWHLCDDAVVRALDLRLTPYPPCCVYLERCDVVSPAKPCLRDGDLQLLPWEDILAIGTVCLTVARQEAQKTGSQKYHDKKASQRAAKCARRK